MMQFHFINGSTHVKQPLSTVQYDHFQYYLCTNLSGHINDLELIQMICTDPHNEYHYLSILSKGHPLPDKCVKFFPQLATLKGVILCYFSNVILDMLCTHYLAMVNESICDVLTISRGVRKAVAPAFMRQKSAGKSAGHPTPTFCVNKQKKQNKNLCTLECFLQWKGLF